MAVTACLAVLATACGTRLSEDQVTALVEGAAGGQPGVAADPGASPAQDPGAADPSAAPDAAGPGAAGGATPAEGRTAGPQDGGNPEQGGGEQADPGSSSDGGGGGAAPADTRAAPPGGNGGATDVGVTGDRIVVYNVSDLTGAVPGLFRDAYEATQAYFQFFTATEGTIYGRQLVLESRDSQLTTQGNRTAYLDACERAFAAVGSMSAFEEGAAEPLACGLPDLRNIPTSAALQRLENSLGAFGLREGDISTGEWTYYQEQYPDAVANAGFVWLENQTTNYQVDLYIRGTTPMGYNWKEQIQVALSETNYARIVTRLEDANIQFVAFQGAYQQAARLVESMQQQSYEPQVFALQSNTYTPDLITTCGGACEKFTTVAANSALLQDIDSNPEMQQYAEWLQRINPNARPTGLGMYSWAAAKLFVQALKEIGPEPTRAKLLEYLRGVSSYDADGLIPAQNIGSQEAAGCVVMLDIANGQFVREAPANGYRCSSTNVR